MSNSSTQPTVFVNAGNDSRPSRQHGRETGVDVLGENFLPGTAVNIMLSTGSRGTAMVGPGGNFSWSVTIKPPLGCDVTVEATVHGVDGIMVEGNGNVFCP